MARLAVFCASVWAVIWLTPTDVQGQTRAVVELFTSQGCSSCPPADKLLAELAQDTNIVAISEHVDYWDYLGWKDTLAMPRNSARQRAYAHRRNDANVFTPQALVNGKKVALGSDKGAIMRGAADHPLAISVTVSVADDRVTVSIPATQLAEKAEVWLCAVSREVTVPIKRGENKGRTITYSNVARRWIKLGYYKGKADTWSLPIDALKDDGADAAAILVQSGSESEPGAILGGAFAALR